MSTMKNLSLIPLAGLTACNKDRINDYATKTEFFISFL
jgi:hypothetical protein